MNAHQWDDAGERCVKCGDKDWMGGPCEAMTAPVAGGGVLAVLDFHIADMAGSGVRYAQREELIATRATVEAMADALRNIRDVAREPYGTLNAAWVASTADAALAAYRGEAATQAKGGAVDSLRDALRYVGQRDDGDLLTLAQRCELWMRESRDLLTATPAKGGDSNSACPRCGAGNETEAEGLCKPDGDSCPGTEWPLAKLWSDLPATPAGGGNGWPAACEWPDKPFTVRDEPGEHDPCWLILPGGEMLAFNHHATNGVDQARAQFLADACNASRPEPWHDKVVTQRDRYLEIADDLANGIAAHFAHDIGEHSSLNDPWQNALDLLNGRRLASTGSAPAPSAVPEGFAPMERLLAHAKFAVAAAERGDKNETLGALSRLSGSIKDYETVMAAAPTPEQKA